MSRVLRCGGCGDVGHYQTTCPRNPSTDPRVLRRAGKRAPAPYSRREDGPNPLKHARKQLLRVAETLERNDRGFTATLLREWTERYLSARSVW